MILNIPSEESTDISSSHSDAASSGTIGVPGVSVVSVLASVSILNVLSYHPLFFTEWNAMDSSPSIVSSGNA